MTHTKLTIAFVAALFLAPIAASAHQVTMYEIGGVEYELVVGSLGEPVIVDDKTGVDFEMVRAGTPVAGAQESLKVEMIAGDARRVMDLSPVFGSEGRYKTTFLATVATTISYRFFGEIEGVPVDLTYTCNPAGHPQAPENNDRIEISPGVVQTHQTGAFGCPQEKAQFGFPEPAHDGNSLAMAGDAMDGIRALHESHAMSLKRVHTLALIGVALGLAAIAFAFVRTRRKPQQPIH